LKPTSYYLNSLISRPQLSNYVYPERNSQIEYQSFVNQANRIVEISKPDNLDNIIEIVNAQYNKINVPSCFLDFSYKSLYDYIASIMYFINPDSSPGVPYMKIAKDNAGVLGAYQHLIICLTVHRIYKILGTDLDVLSGLSNESLVINGFCDPVRLFIKPEPHKLEKINGRERLIMSVSIVDKLVECVLCIKLNKDEIYNWRHIPSKPGIGFSPEDNQFLYNDVMSRPFKVAQTDCRAFDWSIPEWLNLLDFECRIDLTVGATAEYIHLCRSVAIISSRTIYMLSDGTLLKSKINGRTNSGSSNTSSSNSRKRVIAAAIVQARNDFYCIAAGDDTVERYVEDAIKKYAKIGLCIKQFDEIDESFEFCSRLYKNNYSFLVNIDKGLTNLLLNDGNELLRFQYYLQFYNSYCTHPEFYEVHQLLVDVGYISERYRVACIAGMHNI